MAELFWEEEYRAQKAELEQLRATAKRLLAENELLRGALRELMEQLEHMRRLRRGEARDGGDFWLEG